MADEREWNTGMYRKDQDFTPETDEALKTAEDFFSHGKLNECLETLMAMEKTARLGQDTKSTVRLARTIVQTIIKAKDWEKLMEYVELLVKRRSQMKQVVSAIVQESVDALDKTPTQEVKVALIQKLRSICEGKIHVELEYARLTVQIADIWDAAGRLKDATKLMQGLQVETIGNMDKKEKFRIILQQIEMCLRVEDYTIANIMAKKIPHRTIDKDDTLPEKIRLYQLLDQYYRHTKNYYMMCHCHIQIYETIFNEKFNNDELLDKTDSYDTLQSKLQVLEKVILYLLLSPQNARTDEEAEKARNEDSGKQQAQPATGRATLLKRFKDDPQLEELPVLHGVVEKFNDLQLLQWPQFSTEHQSLRSHDILKSDEAWKVMKSRVNEHNLKVISTYYTKITTKRLANLITLETQETEDFLCDLINQRQVKAKIDRVAGIITFAQRQDIADLNNSWRDGIGQVLQLLGTTSHLVTKETMVQQAKSKARAKKK